MVGPDEQQLAELRCLDWEDIGQRVLIYARYWAKAHYFWSEENPLPGEKTPEDIAKEAISAFWEGLRRLNPKYSVLVQIKGAVRSILWNLYAKKESKLTSAEEPAFFNDRLDNGPSPSAQLESKDYERSIFESLYEHERVARSKELTKFVKAFQDGAVSVDEVAEATGFAVKRIYQLRRDLKEITAEVIITINSIRT